MQICHSLCNFMSQNKTIFGSHSLFGNHRTDNDGKLNQSDSRLPTGQSQKRDMTVTGPRGFFATFSMFRYTVWTIDCLRSLILNLQILLLPEWPLVY